MKKLFVLLLIGFGFHSFSQIPADSLIGYWPFNGNALDESGHGYNAVVSGAELTDDRFGIPGSAYHFNGISDFINLTNSFDVIPRTIDLWFNSENVISWYMHECIYESDSPGLLYGNAGIAIKDFDGSNKLLLTISACSDTLDVEVNIWNNVAIVLDQNKTISYYLNGVLASTKVFSQYINSDFGLESAIVGANRFTTGQFFAGKIDDIRIYNRALYRSEIQALYNENITITPTGDHSDNILIYPNPARDMIHIETCNKPLPGNYFTIQITNVTGVVIYKALLKEQMTTLNLSAKAGKGIYFLSVNDSNGKTLLTRKFALL